MAPPDTYVDGGTQRPLCCRWHLSVAWNLLGQLMEQHKFKIGEHVSLSGERRDLAYGEGYEVTRLLPMTSFEPQYRVKRSIDCYERVAGENILRRAEFKNTTLPPQSATSRAPAIARWENAGGAARSGSRDDLGRRALVAGSDRAMRVCWGRAVGTLWDALPSGIRRDLLEREESQARYTTGLDSEGARRTFNSYPWPIPSTVYE
jgi:hypothetical protein